MRSRRWMIVVFAMFCVLFVGVLRQRGTKSAAADGCGITLEGWTKYAETKALPTYYTDGEGNLLVFYVCRTAYYGDSLPEMAGVDPNAIETVTGAQTAEAVRDCEIGGLPGRFYKLGERTYLCWTLSEEVSFVIDYDADVVTAADVVKMAESVQADEIPQVP